MEGKLLFTVLVFQRIPLIQVENVLCVSYPSATEFSAISFLLFDRSSSNSPRSFQRFRWTLRRNFILIRQQIKNFLFTRCRIWMKFCTRIWDAQWYMFLTSVDGFVRDRSKAIFSSSRFTLCLSYLFLIRCIYAYLMFVICINRMSVQLASY